MNRNVGIAALVVAALAAGAARAEAGTYTVYGCSTPDGKPAPLDGWLGTSSPGAPNYTGNADYCSGADPYFVMDHELPAGQPSWTWPFGSAAQYTFTAPPGTQVAAAVVRRRFSGSSAQTMAFRVGGWRGQWPEWCTAYSQCFGLDGEATFTGIDAPSYVIQEVCGGPSDCPDSHTITSVVRRVATTLSDPTAPSFTSPPTGTLLEPGRALAGRVGASLPLRDEGGGLATVRLEVDGAIAGSWPVDGNGGRCVLPYTRVVPCKPAATGTIDWDSNRVADGAHQARLLVDDAAGNTLVQGPFALVVRNTPVACGSAAGGVAVSARLRRGKRTRITGQVTAGGAPVAAATVHLLRRIQRRGSLAGPGGRTALTRAEGSYSLRVPAGPSRTLRAGVRVGAGDTTFTCSKALRLRVRAKVTLHASRRHLGGAGTVRFFGRLHGGYVPRDGKLVVLQGRDGGRWRTFATTRSDRRGRFHARYRFHGVPGAYPVRARVPEDGTYPFATGTSRPVVVRVG